ncbi:MAG: cupredoxin domain-containing protein [Planctomycetes bacterium]|nr:cupredoxin domain-containing protein [Planctomycetota bacterium]
MTSRKRLVGLLLGLAAMIGLTAVTAKPRQAAATQEIMVVAKDMAFNASNPTLRVRLGETVRLTVLNAEEASMSHDLVIMGLSVKTEILRPGDKAELVFVADRPGTFTYFCTLHPRMMTGKFIVEE